jgi:two-component sensor histidine kinase
MSKIDPKINIDENIYVKIFEELNDPCVIFDLSEGSPIIVDSNDSFNSLFCSEDIDPVRKPLNEIIVPDRYEDEAEKLDCRTVQKEINECIVTRKTRMGEKKFLYRGIPLKDNKGFGMYIEISDRIQEREYIGVLNRILRHNLRNQITVMLGNSKMIRNNTQCSEIKDWAENVVESSSKICSLVEESDKARGIINNDLDIKSVQLQPIISSGVKSALSKFEEGEVEVNCDENIYVNANEKLSVVIESLVDNAIRYNKSNKPKVNINCDIESDDNVFIKIRDFGKTIPKQEAEIINNAEDIDDTKHGSGLGLWISRWVVNKLEGDIEIKSEGLNGNIIRIEFPSYNPSTFDYKRGSAIFSC